MHTYLQLYMILYINVLQVINNYVYICNLMLTNVILDEFTRGYLKFTHVTYNCLQEYTTNTQAFGIQCTILTPVLSGKCNNKIFHSFHNASSRRN